MMISVKQSLEIGFKLGIKRLLSCLKYEHTTKTRCGSSFISSSFVLYISFWSSEFKFIMAPNL